MRPWARLSLAILLPLWLVCFGLSVVQFARGQVGYVYLTAAADSPTSYPRIGSIRFPEVAAQSGLQAGDLLVRAGTQDLRGAGPFSSQARILAEMQDHRVPIVYEREGERRETVLDVALRPPVRRYTLAFISVVCGLFGSLVLLRAPRDPRTPTLVVWYMAFAIQHTPFQGSSPTLTYAWWVLYFASHMLILPVAVLVPLAWRNRPAPRFVYAAVWLLAIAGPVRAAQYHGAILPPALTQPILSLVAVIACVAFLGTFVLVMIQGDKLVRRQLSWVIFGAVIGSIPVVLISVAIVLDPGLYWWRQFVSVPLVAVPICIFISIVRYDLLDIHRVMSVTAAYTLLGVVLLTGVLAVVPRVARAANDATGIPTDTAQVMLSLLLAGVLVPGYRVVRPRVDRIFFRERDSIQRGIDQLLYDLAGCGEPEKVTEFAGTRLDALLQPDVCAIYARSGGFYAPVFARGSAVPPVLAGDGPLIEALADERSPLNVERWRRRRGALPLDAADAAFLDTLGARVFVPVHYRSTLALVICLGTKRSGDIYTPTELSLMGRVADRVASELGRFEDAEVIRKGREMQESLRRYVPGAVAEQITSGHSLDAGEREVSVLFVDIRGYTALSQGLAADEIFSTVNRYTDAVSRVVRAHGGSVVEFNGDGMMAVFGAPEALEAKERAAVAAGREIVRTVATLEPAAPVAGRSHLACGVGIATGPAFVGNIQAVDRMIWSAIGNTTNLAARLEALTRDVDAAMVIDTGTWERLGPDRDAFEKRGGTAIRGRSEQQDIYLLPVRSADALPGNRC